MRSSSASEENTALGIIPKAPWRVTDVSVLSEYRLQVRFADGMEGIVDLSNFVHQEQAGVFSSLRNPDVFKQVYIEHGVVTWPDGIDLAPDAMYDSIKEKGTWVL